MGAVVHMQVTGADVIHAWTIPAFGVKIDAVPGRLNETWFQAEEEGIYFGQCSELCGKDHSYMPITVKVVSQEAYDAWLDWAIDEYGGTRPGEPPQAARPPRRRRPSAGRRRGAGRGTRRAGRGSRAGRGAADGTARLPRRPHAAPAEAPEAAAPAEAPAEAAGAGRSSRSAGRRGRAGELRGR